jgi:hypothetical protein
MVHVISVAVLSENCDQIMTGTFFCQICKERKDGPSYRLALLSADHGRGEGVSKIFGKVLATIKAFKDLTHPVAEEADAPRWSYLGPDCSKVTFGNGEAAKVSHRARSALVSLVFLFFLFLIYHFIVYRSYERMTTECIPHRALPPSTLGRSLLTISSTQRRFST